MGLTLFSPPGFADVSDAVFAQNQPAYAINLASVYANSLFGFCRVECFQGRYQNGDIVPLPVSTVDGYSYSRSELIYHWTIGFSGDPSTGWMGGADSLWYGSWLVDQTTGQVFSDEWYRRRGAHYDGVHTNDGHIQVRTIAVRQKTTMIMAGGASYTGITGSTVAQDKPVTQLLAQSLNDDAKFSCLNHEVFYLGEYYDGQTVTMPHSPVDGYVYSSGECKFMFSWRWTPLGNAASLQQPPLSYGQLGPMKASVNSSGVVSTTVEYIDNNGNLNSTNEGRIAVFAFAKRSATPGSITPAATNLAEISFDKFMPGSSVEFPEIQQIINNILESLLTPEVFGPTSYADGSTVSLPTSTVDGYAYSRSELTYIWSWSDTTNQTGSNLRVPIFWGHVDPLTGAVSLITWRLPPGGPYVDDNNTLCRISVITVARRGQVAPSAATAPSITSPSGFTTTGGNVVADIPTLSGIFHDQFTGNSSTTVFTLTVVAPVAPVAMVYWNGVFQQPSKYTISGTTLTTLFTDANGNAQPADTGDTIDVIYFT